MKTKPGWHLIQHKKLGHHKNITTTLMILTLKTKRLTKSLKAIEKRLISKREALSKNLLPVCFAQWPLPEQTRL